MKGPVKTGDKDHFEILPKFLYAKKTKVALLLH